MERTVGRARSVAVVGLDAVEITVEAHLSGGLPGLTVIGSSGSSAREAADRVRTALSTLGVSFGSQKALLSLAPAETPKVGARFDLAMALALLDALGWFGEQALAGTALLGELALDGALRPVPGVLPAAASLEVPRLLVPDGNAAEAALVERLEVTPVASLAEAVEVLTGATRPRPVPAAAPASAARSGVPDLADVRGQPAARRALEVAAAGGHHLLLLGPPGCGKTMLAKRLPSILPPLRHAEALELAAIRSVAGLLTRAAEPGGPAVLDPAPPLRAPHHSVTAPALLGGGSGVARPGEISLAHRGVLLLDELLEWPRRLLDALRAPLEQGWIRLARASATVCYPAKVLLVAAANPCPCGGGRACRCGDEEIWSYRTRLSGPLADRIDLAPTVAPVRAEDLLALDGGEPSALVAERVVAARQRAAARWGAPRSNAEVATARLRRGVDPGVLRGLAADVERGVLTARGFDRTLRVARTCADLAEAERVGEEHVLEARAHRHALGDLWRGVPAEQP